MSERYSIFTTSVKPCTCGFAHQFPIKFGIRLDENWVFGVKNRTSRQKTVTTRHCE